MPKPKDLTSKFFPGLGEQHEVGLANVGITVVRTTLALNSTRTDAQVIASPPNTSVAVAHAFGPVVHSLGTPPTIAFVLPANGSVGAGIGFNYITADNSAVYFRGQNWSAGGPNGIDVRVVAIR